MRFDVLTLFPDMFHGYLGQSLLGKALEKGIIQVNLHNLRDWTRDKHHRVDDRPFGGGPGMVMKVEPVVEGVEEVQKQDKTPGRLLLLSPQGRTLNQRVVEQLAAETRLVLVCGRYEGFDQRVVDILQPDEISMGDFVLNGGEVAAMAVIDSVIRFVPGVLGQRQSCYEDSFSPGDSSRGDFSPGNVSPGDFSPGNRWLEFAQYTRPREYRGHRVPEVLLSGDHEKIAQWRREQSYLKTRQRRPDLIEDAGERSSEPRD